MCTRERAFLTCLPRGAQIPVTLSVIKLFLSNTPCQDATNSSSGTALVTRPSNSSEERGSQHHAHIRIRRHHSWSSMLSRHAIQLLSASLNVKFHAQFSAAACPFEHSRRPRCGRSGMERRFP
eukprot:511733-Pleurochrysis_carterae.AAC.2